MDWSKTSLSALLFLVSVISYGQVEYAGVKGLTTEDASGNAACPANPGERIINDTELTYSDGWKQERLLPRGLGYFCNTRACSGREGATASYLFSDCSGFSWYAGPSEAVAEVYVDGRQAGKVDCSRPDEKGRVFDSGELPEGAHTLVIKAVSGVVEIDRLVCRNAGDSPVTIDTGNGSFVYFSAGFKVAPMDLQHASSLAEAKDAGEDWEFYTKGTMVQCFGDTGPDGGVMELFVDGMKVRNVDLKTRTPSSGKLLFELKDLPAGKYHVIRGSVAPKGGRVAIRHFITDDPSCLMVDMNRMTDAEIARMARHESKATDPKDWRPVGFAATAPVNGVRLGDGIFKTVFDRNVRYLKDCLGRPGWVEMKDGDRIWTDILYASNEGRMLGGMGHVLRFEEIPEFHRAIEDVLEQIDRRQYANGNGYMMPYGSSNYRLSTDGWPGVMRDEQKNYDRAMLTKGMLAAGLAGHDRAYGLLRPFYDWFDGAEEYLPLMLLGSMGIQGSIAGPMVYHSPIGRPEDIRTNMDYYDMDWWLDYLAAGIPEAAWRYTLNRPHNYLLTSVCALFDIYMATGDRRYLDACLGAWKIYSEYFQIPGGGISLCEHFECRPKSYKLTNTPNNIYETCGSVFWIDLNHRFLQLWPDRERYASEIERSLFNVVFAAQGENGWVRYFNQVNGSKYTPGCFNTCCEIQATALYGMLPQYIYSFDDEGIWVNLFSASETSFRKDGNSLSLTMDTGFPYGETVFMRVRTPQPMGMKLRLRVPGWVDKPVRFEVNGKTVAKGNPGTYVVLDRTWQDGDEISFSLPMTWRCEKYTGTTRIEGADRYAFFYGPMLMALEGPMMKDVLQAPGEPSVKFDMTVSSFMKKVRPSGQPCSFSLEGMEDYSFTPYFSLQEGEFTCFPGFVRRER